MGIAVEFVDSGERSGHSIIMKQQEAGFLAKGEVLR